MGFAPDSLPVRARLRRRVLAPVHVPDIASGLGASVHGRFFAKLAHRGTVASSSWGDGGLAEHGGRRRQCGVGFKPRAARRTFDAEIIGDDRTSGCAIAVPFDPLEVFGAVRAPVVVEIGEYRYRSTIARQWGGRVDRRAPAPC